MELYFIRHGQSENNRLWAEKRTSEFRHEDPELTDTGYQQAELLAQFLRDHGRSAAGRSPKNVDDGWAPHNVAGFNLTHLYCSLMVRAVATGTIVSRALGLPLVAWTDAHEVGGMHERDPEIDERIGLPGRNRSYFESNYPDLILPDDLDENGWWNRPFETREQRPARARHFVEELLARHGGTDDRVAVISHGGFYSHVLCAIFEIPVSQRFWFSLENTGITRIGWEEEHIWLGYANRIDFLPSHLVT